MLVAALESAAWIFHFQIAHQHVYGKMNTSAEIRKDPNLVQKHLSVVPIKTKLQ